MHKVMNATMMCNKKAKNLHRRSCVFASCDQHPIDQLIYSINLPEYSCLSKILRREVFVSNRKEYTSCHLEIDSSLHADAGQYKVTLENKLGAASATINVKVIGA